MGSKIRNRLKKNGKIIEIKKVILPILKKYKISRAGLFGSVVRGEARKKSDVDVLIEPPKNMKFSLLDLVGLQLDLEDKLKRKVDIVTYNSIYPLLKDRILKEEVRIL